jgi:hypothetical protein
MKGSDVYVYVSPMFKLLIRSPLSKLYAKIEIVHHIFDAFLPFVPDLESNSKVSHRIGRDGPRLNRDDREISVLTTPLS